MHIRSKRIWLLLGFAFLATSCAFADGEPWGQAEIALVARFDEDGRADEDGRIRTTTNFSVQIDTLELAFSVVTLTMRGLSAEAESFDPADPPEGYSLCHQGHCHHDDGRLVPYEEIAIELAGGGDGSFRVTQAFESSVAVDGDGTAVPGGACDNTCFLEPGALNTVQVPLGAVTVSGVVFDQRTGDSARIPTSGVQFTATVPLSFVLERQVDGVVGEDEPIGVRIDLDLAVSGKLLDGIQWDEVLDGADGSATIDLSNVDDVSTAIQQNLEEHTALDAAVRRFRTD